jgi:GDP-4-dehydro-6-deoxy-D-mannose reductase
MPPARRWPSCWLRNTEITKRVASLPCGLSTTPDAGSTHVGRDFTDVRDVVRAYALVLEKGSTSEVYNVCSGAPVLLSDIIQVFQKISGIDITIEIDPNKVRPAEFAKIYGDPRKLQAATGWLREIALEKTIEDLLSYWRLQVR